MKIIAQSRIKTKFWLSVFLFFILGSVALGCALAQNTESAYPALSGNTDRVIIIDPGHGGIDGGTQAADGTLEKEINLQIALKAHGYLSAFGYNTVLTRDGDFSIHNPEAKTIRAKKVSDLKNRLAIINNSNNPVFVSIHQNYFAQSKYHGTQVFYSGNNADSVRLAESIRKSVCDNLQQDNKRELKQSGTEIYLLYNSTVPSVMVECGFLSNNEEAELLKNETYQTKIAYFIAMGIIDYLNSTEAV